VLNEAGEVAGWRPAGRFVLNQDTGGAIRGLRRVDIYFGSGDRAGGLAGYMNRQGRMFFLIRKKKAE
jgi:membrane-bound lytic murein transglycosylase A